MTVANFRFYAELNNFLLPERRFTEFAYGFLDVATVKDRIESFGVPVITENSGRPPEPVSTN